MLKLLIVEDEEMIRKGLRYTFNWSKSDIIVVDEACNGKEGLEKIQKLNPDIVILDINMPIMDGLTMIENSIKEYPYSAIIISGYNEFEYAKKAIHFGVTEYLLKPLDSEQLYNALERAKEQVLLIKEHNIVKDSLSQTLDFDSMQKAVLKDVLHTSYHVNKMIEYVKNEYSNKITIQNLVDNLGASSTYLNQKFKKETSYTFNDYVNRYRIRQAINLMQNENIKIYTVAIEVGFKDYRYFINVFKKYTGCTPSDFMEYFKYSKVQ